MKIRHALVGASAAALIAAGGSSYGLSPSSPVLGPLTNILGALVYGHVANNAALAQMPVALGRVRRDGFATAGDGGVADYTLTTTPCAIAGGDGGSQIPLNGGGCAIIDWGSVGYVARAPVFGAFGAGNLASDTTAIQNALNTGNDVVLPYGISGSYYVYTSVLTFKRNNQKIIGVDGGRTTIGCYLPASVSATNPCLNTNSLVNIGFTNIGLYYPGAPDTTNLSALAPYGPLIYAQNSPGLRMDDLILSRAYVDVDMRGNSGGGIFNDVKFSCLFACWQVDGSLDTNTWNNPHGFVYSLTPNQVTVFYTIAVGWSVGRQDDFRINGGLYIGHLAFDFFNGAGTNPGPAFGGITNFDCDTHSCIMGELSYTGDIEGTNITATLADAAEQAFVMQNGSLSLSSPSIAIGASLTNPAVQAIQGGYIAIDGGKTQYLDNVSVSPAARFDATALQSGSTGNSGGILQVTGHRILKPAGTSASPIANTMPIVAKYGRLNMMNTVMSDSGTLSTSASTPNQFIYAPNDNFDRIIGNVSPGWPNLFPSSVSSAVITGNNPPSAPAAPN